MDPGPDTEMENKEQKTVTIEDSWKISSDEPVRFIKWCSLKVVEETAQQMRVFLGGVFERINPLVYHGKYSRIDIFMRRLFSSSWDIMLHEWETVL